MRKGLLSSRPIVFVDSSIPIAGTVRERPMKAKISSWLSRYRLKITGSIALQEYKRRVLRDIAYLLTKLNQTDSYHRTLDYVTSVLPTQQQRKKQICILLLHQLLHPPATDSELTERARYYLRTLLVLGERNFVDRFDSVSTGINCYWAWYPVRERTKYRAYDLGDVRCSKARGLCQIGTSLEQRRGLCATLFEFLSSLPQERMTSELNNALGFLRNVLNANGFQNVQDTDPCLKVGDLLLALESAGVPEVYTMNYHESQAYCEVLKQNLVVRPNDPSQSEREYLQSDKPWAPKP